MDIKVGDIVEYNNSHARVMRIVEDDDEGIYKADLAAQGFDAYVSLDELELIESVKLSNFETYDMVVVHNIPTHEKKNYGCGWMHRMAAILDGQPHQITHVRNHPEEGMIVRIMGCWFHAYHVEHAQDYDIV